MGNNISATRLGEMKEAIFENMFGAALDDGVDEMEAEEAARDYVEGLTKEEIIKEYKEMTK